MAAAIKGTGVVWSVGAIVFTAGIVRAATDGYPQTVSFSRASEKVEVKDNGGTIKAGIFSAFKKTATITVVPAGSTVANARTSADTYMPATGTTVSLTDDSGTILDGTYNLISSRANRTVDGVETIDLELETGDEGNDITTLIS